MGKEHSVFIFKSLLFNLLVFRVFEIGDTKIELIRQMRNIITVRIGDGEVQKLRLVTPIKKKVNASKSSTLPKRAKPQRKQKKVNKSKCDGMAEKMVQCSVVLDGLSQKDIDSLKAKVKREEKVKRIQSALRNLPRKLLIALE